MRAASWLGESPGRHKDAVLRTRGAASPWNRATTSLPTVVEGSYRLAWTAIVRVNTRPIGAVPIPSIPSSPDPPTRLSSIHEREQVEDEMLEGIWTQLV